MKRRKIKSMGMILDEWTHLSCKAEIGVGEYYATIYYIESEEEGKGHATELLKEMKAFYEGQVKTFGSTIALSEAMRHLLVKLNIPEYE